MVKSKSAPKTSPAEMGTRISEAEWVVMKTLWGQGPLTTNQVVTALKGQSAWKPKTIHTLLKRLVDKGALAFERAGREYRFTPRLSSVEAEHAATRSFLDRFFGGDLAPFLARFVQRENLSATELERLKTILDSKTS